MTDVAGKVESLLLEYQGLLDSQKKREEVGAAIEGVQLLAADVKKAKEELRRYRKPAAATEAE